MGNRNNSNNKNSHSSANQYKYRYWEHPKNERVQKLPVSQLKPFEEQPFKVLLADLITGVQNGMDPEEARNLAYERIYMSID